MPHSHDTRDVPASLLQRLTAAWGTRGHGACRAGEATAATVVRLVRAILRKSGGEFSGRTPSPRRRAAEAVRAQAPPSQPRARGEGSSASHIASLGTREAWSRRL